MSFKKFNITTEFFKRRFPKANIELEKEIGYFQQWEKRIATGNPEPYMDEESLEVWNNLIKEIKGEE
jgi:hypothetical protein